MVTPLLAAQNALSQSASTPTPALKPKIKTLPDNITIKGATGEIICSKDGVTIRDNNGAVRIK
uniref:Uncharacterized protein n=1 Tax=Pectobacterium carotovorum TaxID=554 RepID=A0A0K0MPZ3_PECCA|nr:hypothetical protein [Pectobacterium carotovorum]AKG47509.1 hypothetical protein pA_00069 [Pectobacterium carotovorum]